MTDVTLPADRKATTEAIKARLAIARNDGASQGEKAALELDAANFLKRELRSMRDEYAKAVPTGYDPEMLVRDACTAVSRTEGLWEAEASTVLGAVMSAGQLGLRLGVLGQSWILPFWNGRNARVEAQLIIGYQGYLELCYRSGKVVEVSSEIVYQREYDDDRFDFGYVEERPWLRHNPDLTIASRRSCPRCNETNPKCDNIADHGEMIYAFYARARTQGGGFFLPRPWGLEMMREHRRLYAKKTRAGVVKGPWSDQFPAMGQKTMIRQLVRTLPKSPELAHALAADEGVRHTFNANVKPGDATVHDDYDGVILDGQTAEDAAEDAAERTQHPADR